MTWWERIKVGWVIANMIKPIKNADKIGAILQVIEEVIKKEKEDGK